jgi:hypothetical protein
MIFILKLIMRILVTENQYKRILEFYEKGYSFDWDDNVLNMPTKIHLEKKSNGGWKDYEVSTEKFREIRHELDGEKLRLKNNNPNDAFKDFKTEIFIQHTKDAINNDEFGPSFKKFKKALIKGYGFSIITARGTSKDSLRKGIKVLIDMTFSDEEKETMNKNLKEKKYKSVDDYLNDQQLSAVSSEEFKTEYQSKGGAENPEIAKTMAFEKYVESVVKKVEHLVDHPEREGVKIGFSDDDLGNIKKMEEFIRKELLKKYPKVKFVIYDTSNPKDIKKKFINIELKE